MFSVGLKTWGFRYVVEKSATPLRFGDIWNGLGRAAQTFANRRGVLKFRCLLFHYQQLLHRPHTAIRLQLQ